jgi:TonB family protein
MSADLSAPTIALAERSVRATGSQERLSKWVGFSFVFHLALIAALFITPFLPSRRIPEAPIYTVDLVGGEKLGGNNFGTEISAPPRKPAAKKTEAAPAPVIEKAEKKVEARKEKIDTTEKAPPKDKALPPQETLALKQPPRKEPVKKEPPQAANDRSSEEDALERVRERLIQSAAQRAKSRTESAQTGSSSAAASSTKTSPSSKGGEVISAGPGEGEGAAALGQGGRGGGVVKGIEFISYRNRVLTTIRENWSWVPQRTDLKVTVHFGIRDNGEIVGLKIVQPSGDRTYDESVLRALRKSTPLPPPPESYRSEFMDYTITFTPKDLGA